MLLLRGRLEGFELEEHARSLLSIPRVIALEATRARAPRILLEGAALRQARRLRFPGRVRLLVVYHPAQYALARGLRDRHDAELWYVEPHPDDAWVRAGNPELQEADALARERAVALLPRVDATSVQDEALRVRLRELDVINPYAFVPAERRWRGRL
ncbi:MAG TPA: hypothetical protein VKV21_00810 [Solirubrobacteraceae bacterium]|nr:hypothetical protein [Solirubrobacteraceae bacterium]